LHNKKYSKGDYLEFEEKLDEEVVMEAKAGNSRAQEYLINKYKILLRQRLDLTS
jgi:RNA polymerase sporulation-specific sigma factor